ncbi:MAG: Carboxypeptidase regulatory-like domain [Chthonomonadaceae bacterium]|nr:Carboxypeptidase regulatory-like domain [Chthonomonadaceae bacterium]
MRFHDPTLPDEVRTPWLRSLRIFLAPAVLALALYTLYAVGNYRERDQTLKPLRHGNIYGTVVDEKERPVPGASITISYTSSKDPIPADAFGTDALGHFYLQDLPSATYVLQATLDGFDMQTQTMFLKPGTTLQIKLPLYRKSSRLHPPGHSSSPEIPGSPAAGPRP